MSDDNSEAKRKVHEFLASHPVGVLATVDKLDNPHATTIYFSVDSDLNVTFISKRDTTKSQNIARNNKVVIVAYDPKSQTNVQLFGEAQNITHQDDASAVFSKILEICKKTSGTDVPPISKLFAGHYVSYKLKLNDIVYSVYNSEDWSMAKFISIDF